MTFLTRSVLLGLALALVTAAVSPDQEQADELSSMRMVEESRDPHSKPEQVYDFVGFEAGDTVVDLLAGTGYKTFLLSKRVGPTGRIYAEKATERLRGRVENGDLRDAGNVSFVEGLAELPEDAVDGALLVRAYHLMREPMMELAELWQGLRPGGVLGIVEARIDRPRGHDTTSHRMGEKTIIEQLQAAGFEYLGESELLRRDDDDYSSYRAGQRHMTDRMLLKFQKPASKH